MSIPHYEHAIVVGASSGIGREITLQLAESGCRVAAIARREDRLQDLANQHPDHIIPFTHDVTDYQAVPAVFQEATKALGGLDIIIYASGVMPEVGPKEFNFDKDHHMIEVNCLGAVAWLNQAAERMQSTKYGTILAIGSVAGERGRQGQPVYNSSKAFLHTYMEALRNRIARYGIKVVTIKPGPTETEMTSHLKLNNAMPADEAATLILQKSTKTGEHYLKFTHAIAFFIIRNFPSWIFRRLKV